MRKNNRGENENQNKKIMNTEILSRMNVNKIEK